MPKSHTPFAVFNRVMNPGIKLLLGSGLHRPLSGQLALITVTGKKTGREYTFPVSYTRDGELVKVDVGWPERKRWWRNLREPGAEVKIRIGGRDYVGHAVAHGDEEQGVTVEVRMP